MSDINKKKLFIPRKLSGENSRWSDWNNSQPIKDGVRINQYDMEGLKQGYWEENWENTDKLNSKGNYIDDVKEGLWVFYHSDGSIWYEEEFKNGDQSKMIIYYYEGNELESKQLYVKGKYVKDIPLTESKKIFIPRKLSDDDSRYSEWNNKQPVKDGEKINQYDSEGRKQGIWEERDDDGDDEIGQGLYLNNERNGVWEFYDTISNQIFAKGQYVDGHPDGIWEYYNPLNGELEGKRLYNNGEFVKELPLTESKKLFIPRKLSGENSRWSDWNKEQPIKDGVRINQYDNEGRKQGYWEQYYDDGSLDGKGNYVNDMEDGYWEWYHENGQLASQGLSVDNQRDGIWEIYYDNGNLNAKGNYINGLEDGIWKFYHPNGELRLKKLYNNGELVIRLPLTESKTPSFLLKEEMGLIREGNVQDYINNVISKIKNLPYETKKKYLTIAISTLLGYTSYPVIQSIFDKSPDKEAKEIVRRVMDKKDKVSMFNDGTKFRLSKKGFQHIMDEEKPKLIAYALGDGKITVGYGHAEPVATTKLKVGQKITKEQAKIYLKEDLKIAADGVRRMFRDWKKQDKNYKITQDMFDALVSMAFNMGVSGLRNTNLVDYLRDGDYKTAGQLIKKTNIDNDSFPGLEKRRYKESDMFLSYLLKPTNVNT
jgi:antitoxin component YwqK of YwqJK toxin-antitoxin module/GH24 family phage-related lysozyme (muramidase)